MTISDGRKNRQQQLTYNVLEELTIGDTSLLLSERENILCWSPRERERKKLQLVTTIDRGCVALLNIGWRELQLLKLQLPATTMVGSLSWMDRLLHKRSMKQVHIQTGTELRCKVHYNNQPNEVIDLCELCSMYYALYVMSSKHFDISIQQLWHSVTDVKTDRQKNLTYNVLKELTFGDTSLSLPLREDILGWSVPEREDILGSTPPER